MKKITRRNLLKFGGIALSSAIVVKSTNGQRSSICKPTEFDARKLPWTDFIGTMDDAQKLFDRLNKSIDAKLIYKYGSKLANKEKVTNQGYALPFQFLQSQCQMRSHYMSREIVRCGKRPYKVVLIGETLYPKTPDSEFKFTNYQWGMHTAPILKAKLSPEKPSEYVVFDPSTQLKPVTVNEWRDSFKPLNATLSEKEQITFYAINKFSGFKITRDDELNFNFAFKELKSDLDRIQKDLIALKNDKFIEEDRIEPLLAGLGMANRDDMRPNWLK